MFSRQKLCKKLCYDTAAVVVQGDLQSQAMVRAVARQVCEQLIQGKYINNSCVSLSRMDLFLPQCLQIWCFSDHPRGSVHFKLNKICVPTRFMFNWICSKWELISIRHVKNKAWIISNLLQHSEASAVTILHFYKPKIPEKPPSKQGHKILQGGSSPFLCNP